jgi:hypothetical protein
MAKQKKKPGLPDNFGLNVPDTDPNEGIVDEPINLGDFLDEDPVLELAKARQKKMQEQAEAAARVEANTALKVEPVEEDEEEPEEEVVVKKAPQKKASKKKASSKPKPGAGLRVNPRLEVNLPKEAYDDLDDIVRYVQKYGLQRDTKTSEIVHAMIKMMKDSLDELSLEDVPRRGRWGSPTARAYPISLSRAFIKAIKRNDG